MGFPVFSSLGQETEDEYGEESRDGFQNPWEALHSALQGSKHENSLLIQVQIFFGSSWFSCDFHNLISGRRWWVSCLLELTNCYDSGGKKICSKKLFDFAF